MSGGPEAPASGLAAQCSERFDSRVRSPARTEIRSPQSAGGNRRNPVGAFGSDLPMVLIDEDISDLAIPKVLVESRQGALAAPPTQSLAAPLSLPPCSNLCPVRASSRPCPITAG